MKTNLTLKLKLLAPRWIKKLGAWYKTPSPYKGDGMILHNRNIPFMSDGLFWNAYEKALDGGHKINGGGDLSIEWRCHIALWAARKALTSYGDFVECGVNTGILSKCVCEYYSLEYHTDRMFWLFDTFNGIPVEQASKSEVVSTLVHNQMNYEECFAQTINNFARFPVKFVRGKVPDTLTQFPRERRVSYLSLDMNIAYPEQAALEYFWPLMLPGGVIILDDYGHRGHEEQQRVADQFARLNGVSVLCLPTGQGLIIKN